MSSRSTLAARTPSVDFRALWAANRIPFPFGSLKLRYPRYPNDLKSEPAPQMSTIRNPFRTAAIVAVATIGTIATAGAAAVASAGGSAPAYAPAAYTNDCTNVVHSGLANITTTKKGAAKLNDDPKIKNDGKGAPLGLIMSTTVADPDDSVLWKINIPGNEQPKTKQVKGLSYRTIKLDKAGPDVNDAALPAYRVYVDIPNVGVTTFVWEPYWQPGVGNPTRGVEVGWDPFNTGKWWSTKALPPAFPADNTKGGPPTKTWAEIAELYPNANVTGYGIGLGTYNKGTIAWLDHVVFKAQGKCVDHQWKYMAVSPSSSSKSPSTTTSPNATITVTASRSGAATLPVTGQSGNTAGHLAVGGLLFVIVGAVAIAISRNRRRRFVNPEPELN